MDSKALSQFVIFNLSAAGVALYPFMLLPYSFIVFVCVLLFSIKRIQIFHSMWLIEKKKKNEIY